MGTDNSFPDSTIDLTCVWGLLDPAPSRRMTDSMRVYGDMSCCAKNFVIPGSSPGQALHIKFCRAAHKTLSSCAKAQDPKLNMDKQYYVYMLASQRNGTLYIGVTSDLIKRVWEHKHKIVGGFTAKYDVTSLVYYEIFSEIAAAIKREKKLKFWQRKWKLNLIEKMNPTWRDLYQNICS